MSLLARIRAQGGEAVLDGYRLRLKRGRLSDDALAWLKENRRRLVRELWPAFDDWEERAAIREFDGGEDRETAERNAYAELAGC